MADNYDHNLRGINSNQEEKVKPLLEISRKRWQGKVLKVEFK